MKLYLVRSIFYPYVSIIVALAYIVGGVGIHYGWPDLVRYPLHAGHHHGPGIPGPILLPGRLPAYA